ncbi:tetratricopeptide repeat protein [Mycolicibacterium neoaurum]|uniref:tetratricopeptide repeat protein n=1 Tax=Mycolicibacterium neoaurum TaxID=1795 RepID=UPI0030157014
MPDLVDAAAAALARGDLAVAEEQARSALADGTSLPALLILAQALAWQGRGTDADTVLARVDPAGLGDADLIAWALPRAANQFWMLDQPERATAFLRAIRGRLSSAVTIDALLCTFAMNAGSPQRALDIAESVLSCDHAEDRAVGWAAAAAGLSAARMGRFDQVDGLAARAGAAGHPGVLRFTSAYGQITARLLTGDIGAADEVADGLVCDTGPSRAIALVLRADIALARGVLDEAVEALREAAPALSTTGYSWGPLAWMLLAQAHAQQGRAVDAAKALSRAESRHGLKSMLFAPELALAKAWTAAARRDQPGAVRAAREAARAALRGGQHAVALRALHDAVRLGDTRAAEAVAGVSCECVFGRLTAEHAQALSSGDIAGLESVAARWDGLGWGAAARDAARQAGRS